MEDEDVFEFVEEDEQTVKESNKPSIIDNGVNETIEEKEKVFMFESPRSDVHISENNKPMGDNIIVLTKIDEGVNEIDNNNKIGFNDLTNACNNDPIIFQNASNNENMINNTEINNENKNESDKNNIFEFTTQDNNQNLLRKNGGNFGNKRKF